MDGYNTNINRAYVGTARNVTDFDELKVNDLPDNYSVKSALDHIHENNGKLNLILVKAEQICDFIKNNNLVGDVDKIGIDSEVPIMLKEFYDANIYQSNQIDKINNKLDYIKKFIVGG